MAEEIREEFERPLKTRLAGEVTLEDYKNVRDLRLLYWTLKTELCERHGIRKACEVATKLVPLIETKLEELEGKTRR